MVAGVAVLVIIRRLLGFNRTTVVLIHTSRVVVLVCFCSRVVSAEVVSPVQP